MNNEQFEAEIITLLDDEGQEHEFEVLDAIETDDGRFVALLPVDESVEEEMGVYYIFEVIDGEDGEDQLAEVEDDDLLDSLAEIFESRIDALFEDCDDEECDGCHDHNCDCCHD